MSRPPLSPAQLRLWQTLCAHITTHGLPPTVAELSAQLGIKPPSVHAQLQALARKGWLRHTPHKARSLTPLDEAGQPLLHPKESTPMESRPIMSAPPRVTQRFRPAEQARFTIPLAGSRVAAGFPSPADDFVEAQLDLNQHLVKHPAATFFVRVAGESMIEAGIHPGDILVVDRSLQPESGQIVIAVLDGELTVKRLEKRAGKLFLMPANRNFTPIEVGAEADLLIWGVVTSTVHQFGR
ncbi:SOS response UmuD protein, Serine peptidase, MEROPS family S24 [Magnetococcus marinus MC-1]|uniref:SOS response UmuD protein, Serine peptidase, MEROPS family S24 n=1 Tax=Magnetococcus marinus (strain ATCC BAA-1437 / JCM 17883 / MC-1) TaxID=156889 RepID=A0L9G3_MAGMM|nr:transcriptional repressor LexA [Magnetococcus marinus]ABK44606.1 SOS response UmuD protein, Serine peptidase, MEROPS family S24 [Magnetococcus marinus MC-1]